TMRAWLFILSVVPAWGLAENLSAGEPPSVTMVLGIMFVVSILPALVNVIGELIAGSVASAHPAATALRLAPLAQIFSVIFHPASRAASWLAELVAGRFGTKPSFTASFSMEQLRSILAAGRETGDIEPDREALMANAIDFGDRVAEQVMTPRVRLESIHHSTTVAETARIMKETGHSRLPVYDSNDDNILHIVHAKDIMSALMNDMENEPVSVLPLRAATFVPTSRKLRPLLDEMNRTGAQMVVVHDEFGGTAGIVTVEDIVEEVMGEIWDEYDAEEAPGFNLDAGGWSVRGDIGLEEVNRRLDLHLSSEDFDSIGGYVFGLFGRQPDVGESITEGDITFMVAARERGRISRIKMTWPGAENVAGGVETWSSADFGQAKGSESKESATRALQGRATRHQTLG
ncbi:MAG: hemolysin family protein, partial [Fimbriimonadaceae bacterium]|nr:hemolysin family protein [Fimbriimonadaceae bacterium]